MFCSREGHDNTLAYIQRQLTFTILSAEAVRTNTFVNVRSLVETRTTIKTRVRVTNWNHCWKRNVNKLMHGLFEEHLANFSKDLLQPLSYGSVIYTRWTMFTLRSNTFVFYSLVFFFANIMIINCIIVRQTIHEILKFMYMYIHMWIC